MKKQKIDNKIFKIKLILDNNIIIVLAYLFKN